MAPSPEKTIEPKAPDKQDCASSSDSSCEQSNRNNSDTKESVGQLPTQEPQENPPILSGLDEGQLKALLEEAITYKCPKDRECKSNLFKELLQEAESVEAPPPLSRTRFQSERNENRSGHHHSQHQHAHHNHHQLTSRHSQRQLSHGGSLQDLAETNKLDNYSSRKNTGAKRKTVSVSARQSEGGSLPSNVNSSIYSTCDRLFLYEDTSKYKFKKTNTAPVDKTYESETKDSKRSDSETYTTSCEINLNETSSSSSSLLRFSPVPSLIDPHVIEDLLFETTCSDEDQKQLTPCARETEQEKSLSDDRSLGRIDSKLRVNYTSHAELHINMENNNPCSANGAGRSSRNDLGATIQFSQLDSKLLAPGYSSVQCLVGNGKSSTISRPISWLTSQASLIHDETKKPLDENGNSLQAFNSTMASSQQQNALKTKREKPKQKKSDRNVKVIRSEEVVGHRNETNIDLLVQFIESDVNPKKGKTNYKSDHVNNKRLLDDKNNKKKDSNRKTNSKDLQRKLFKSNSLEEVSCSMLEDLTNHNSDITMRNKLKKDNHSTNDRRSWGEVSYNMDDPKYSNEIHTSANVSNEAVATNYAECAEFHVVTKKKKPKKYHNHNIFSHDRKMQRNDYYQNNDAKFKDNSFTGNHDLYLNAEQRRKSTSSMPPSDKSDSSDLDSVHSLPVESTSKKLSVRQMSMSSGGTPQASYADIAKMANVVSNDMCFNAEDEKWSPSVPKNRPSLIESTTPGTGTGHPKTMSLTNYNFPDLIESCHYYSEVQKKKENEDSNVKVEKSRPKLKLSQSKSVDVDDAHTQNRNLKTYCNSTSNPVLSNKDSLKRGKTKSEMEESNMNKNTKKSNKICSNVSCVENSNNIHEEKKQDNCVCKNTSDLVSDCMHFENLKVNESDSSHLEKTDLPPVVILDEEYDTDLLSNNDIIFGFELNEKLLSGELSDTDSSNTIVYQETETESNDTTKKLNCVENSENAGNLQKISSEVIEENNALISVEDNIKKNICDNQELKTEDRKNKSKCLNEIQFIPPTNVNGFENHDKIVSFIGIAWDEILKGGTAQYYTA